MVMENVKKKQEQGLTIKEWEKSERPREKFLASGGENLTTAELLAIVIGSGTTHCNALETARQIFNVAGNNLRTLKKFTKEDLMKFRGIGETRAVTIMAVFELMKRLEIENAKRCQIVASAESVLEAIEPYLRDLDHEECWVLYINAANRLIDKERLSVGGVSATVLDPKIIIKHAMLKLAHSIILVHNHPGGNCRPSRQDIAQTKRLKEAAETCDIVLSDHLVLGDNEYYSFVEHGIL